MSTADGAGETPYLIPLSFLWDGTTLLLATPAASPTGRNLRATGKVRLGIGPTRDVVLVEEPPRRWRPPRCRTESATPSPRRPASTRAD